MSKERSVSQLIEYHKTLTIIHRTFSVMAVAFLIILILMLFITERQPFKVVIAIATIVLINAGISYIISKYADKIYGRINQGGSLTKS